MSALGDAKTLAKYNNDLERANVKLQYDYNRSLAQEDRAWQERMANSAHQREIADLKAAGLNPVLSITGGNGAATPSGSSASVSKPNVDMSLPRAVMDMAIAQLNSATSLQTTAMNNATAIYQHDNPGANSPIGIAEYALGDDSKGLKNSIKSLFKSWESSAKKQSTNQLISSTKNKLDSYIALSVKDNKNRLEQFKYNRLKRQLDNTKKYHPDVYIKAVQML